MLSSLALFPNRDVAAFLLEHEKWKEMLMSFDRESATPMRGLIVFMPGKPITVSTTQGHRHKLKLGKGRGVGVNLRGHRMREVLRKL